MNEPFPTNAATPPPRPLPLKRLVLDQMLLGLGWLLVCSQRFPVEPWPSRMRGALGILLFVSGGLVLSRSYFMLGLTMSLNAIGCVLLAAPVFWSRPDLVQIHPHGTPPPVAELLWWAHVDLRWWMSVFSLVALPLAIADLYRVYRQEEKIAAWRAAHPTATDPRSP